MNNDYLFEKQGNDREIEMLEETLSVYRITPVAPTLKRTAIAEKPEQPFHSFRFLFTYAAVLVSFAVLVIVGFSALWFVRRPADVTALSPAEVITPATTTEPAIALEGPTAPAIKKPSHVETKQKQFVQTRADRKPQFAKFIQRNAPAKPRLTQEEKYAYEQVKLALWLAGSKLKVVQDTIDRTGDKEYSSTDKR